MFLHKTSKNLFFCKIIAKLSILGSLVCIKCWGYARKIYTHAPRRIHRRSSSPLFFIPPSFYGVTNFFYLYKNFSSRKNITLLFHPFLHTKLARSKLTSSSRVKGALPNGPDHWVVSSTSARSKSISNVYDTLKIQSSGFGIIIWGRRRPLTERVCNFPCVTATNVWFYNLTNKPNTTMRWNKHVFTIRLIINWHVGDQSVN